MRVLLVFAVVLLAAAATPVCENGGTPKTDGSTKCDCTAYWTGDLCETIAKCANGGEINADKTACTCDPQWKGADCATIDCKNGGVPNGVNGCDCSAYSSGADCGTITKCANGGELKSATECDCPSYWTGDCSTIECVNGGYAVPITKTSGQDRQSCHCPKGYYGIHCDAVKPARRVEGVFDTKPSFNLYIHNELTDWYGQKAYKNIQNAIGKLTDDIYSKYNLLQSTRGGILTIKRSNYLDEFISIVNRNQAIGTHKYTCLETDISYRQLLDALKNNGIEDSVILMYTQYPPAKDQQDDLAELKKYLRAFRIKLNVLLGADDILLDCNSKKNKDKKLFEELTDLVYFTDGEITSFLVEEETDDNEMLPAFLRSSARPQSHSRTASKSCEIGTKFSFQTDPYPNTYYIAVRSNQGTAATLTGSCSSGGEVIRVSDSYYGEFSLFSILSGAKQTCTLTATADGECLATVYSTGGDPEVDTFGLFYSFTTSPDMDSDSISAYANENFYLSLHVEISPSPKYPIVKFNGNFVANNEIEMQYGTGDLVRRGSSFDYQSTTAIDCPDGGQTWIQLSLEGFNKDDQSLAVLNRIVPVNCEKRTAPVSSTTHLLRLLDGSVQPSAKKPTLALMFSNRLPTQQFSKFILESVDDSMKDMFFPYGFLRFDAATLMDFDPYTDFAEFKRNVYDKGPDNIGDYDNLIRNINELTEGAKGKVTSDSLVSIAIDHALVSVDAGNSYSANLAKLANLGARLLFWGDIDTIKLEQESDTLEMYTRMAAVSAGHLILIDMSDFDDSDPEDDDPPFYVSSALRDMYTSGPSQRLLAYSNLEWDFTGQTSTTQFSSLGNIQVPEGINKIFVSITFNVEDPAKFVAPFMASLVLDAGSDRIAYNLDDFTQYGPTTGNAKPRSNLITASIDVQGGLSYDGSMTILAMVPYTSAHIRFWTNRTDDDILPDLKYVDFEIREIQPDNYYGAALNVPELNAGGEETEKMSLRFLDHNGVDAQRLDHNQTVEVINGVAHFVPYFCNEKQSEFLSKDMYTIEIAYEGGFKYYRPMLCGNNPTTPKCPQDVHDGNAYCVESNPPFHRGPSELLIDCSGVGQVVYSTDSDVEHNYKCICEKGFAGRSCEQSSCDDGIVHVPGEKDAAFRTLSYVFLSPAGDEACSSMVNYYANDAKASFAEAATYENIWQYTFSVYFTDGTAKTLYRGASYNQFYETFGQLTSETLDPSTFCGNQRNTNYMDMNSVFNLAVESVGRNSRGIVFFYAAQTFIENQENNELKNIVVSEEFYESVQAYQQQIYFVTPTITQDIISLTTASGGIAVRMLSDFDTFSAGVVNFQKAFNDILRSEVGWTGVLTRNETTQWKITQDVEVFTIGGKSNNGYNAPVLQYCGNSPAGIVELEGFPFDSSYDEDHTVSQHAKITASPSEPKSICITFEESKYDLVQVVILTKNDPIIHALIGQGQANTDKHSAGATTSTVKAAHISFNRPVDTYTFEPSNNNWREAARLNCSFAQEFVAFTQPFTEIGPEIVDFTVTQAAKDANDPDAVSSISVPLVVTETINCANGGTFDKEGSFCQCADGYSGPTCSQPSCDSPGRLNSHGDHCDCTGADAGGLFCRKE